MIVKGVKARAIKDSRGKETIEVSVNGQKASSPSGKSTGTYETKSYYKSFDWNINFLNNWKERVEINKFQDLKKIEKIISKKLGNKNVKEFGANALFAFESAILKSLASSKNLELWQTINPKARNVPFPVGNAVGGGLHSSSFKGHPDFQEFLIIPKSNSFSKNVEIMHFIYEEIGKVIKSKKKNDEGAWQASKDNGQVLNIINQIRKKAENKFGDKIEIGLDVAASSFYKNNKYNYKEIKRNTKEQINHIEMLVLNQDVFYIEDPFNEEDFKSFSIVNKNLKNRLIVGDDLTVTHIDRLKKAIRNKSINGIIIKPNQNGSLIELKEIFNICKKHGIKTIMSHRSGETLDEALADYAFGFGADYIKCGISTPWREVKLIRMLEIEKLN